MLSCSWRICPVSVHIPLKRRRQEDQSSSPNTLSLERERERDCHTRTRDTAFAVNKMHMGNGILKEKCPGLSRFFYLICLNSYIRRSNCAKVKPLTTSNLA